MRFRQPRGLPLGSTVVRAGRWAFAAALLVPLGCRSPQPEQVRVEEIPAVDHVEQARAALAEQGIEEVRWGLTPFFTPDRLVERYTPIVDLLAAGLGVPIRLVVGKDYKDLVDQVVTGQVDVGVLGPYAYVRARRRAPGLRVFASHVAHGSLTYGSYIISREGSGVESLADVRGKPFGYVDYRSTSGWLFPAARMLQAGLDPRTDVEPRFLGAHDLVVDAVLSGEVAAGATYDGGLVEARARDPLGTGLRVIAKGDRIPYDAYVLREGFPEVVGRALGQLLSDISTRTQGGRLILSNISRINGFVPVDDSHYDTVRQVEARVLSSLGESPDWTP